MPGRCDNSPSSEFLTRIGSQRKLILFLGLRQVVREHQVFWILLPPLQQVDEIVRFYF